MDTLEPVSTTLRVPGPGSAAVPFTAPAERTVAYVSRNKYDAIQVLWSELNIGKKPLPKIMRPRVD